MFRFESIFKGKPKQRLSSLTDERILMISFYSKNLFCSDSFARLADALVGSSTLLIGIVQHIIFQRNSPQCRRAWLTKRHGLHTTTQQ
jgi:hypothetical protein